MKPDASHALCEQSLALAHAEVDRLRRELAAALAERDRAYEERNAIRGRMAFERPVQRDSNPPGVDWERHYVRCTYCGLWLGRAAMRRFGSVWHACDRRAK